MKSFTIIFTIFLLIFSAGVLFSQNDRNSLSSEDQFERAKPQAPFMPSWTGNDVVVDTGSINNAGFRQIGLKMGPDGSLYMAVNKKNVAGTNGRINFFRSSNGGITWNLLGSITSVANFFGQISMLVENRDAANMDSTRIIVFYTRAATTNLFDAALYWGSVRRDGSAFIGGSVGTPAASNKFYYPAAVSDGQYFSDATSIGVVVGEYNNVSEVSINLRIFKSTDWGTTFTGAAIVDAAYPTASDYLPTADFKKGLLDSVYIVAERRTLTDSTIRLIKTSWTPTPAGSSIQFSPLGVNMEKPVITIVQNVDPTNVQGQMMITAVKNGTLPTYYYSTNSGTLWFGDFILSATQNRTKFTWCASDTNSAGGGNFIVTYVNNFGSSGDSLSVKRGTLANLGATQHKVNSVASSFVINPVCAIYNNGTTKYSATSYAGVNQFNIYFDGEHLPVGIQNVNGQIPQDFKLSQNYPNPFNPSTKIEFALAAPSSVRLVVYDMLGKEISTLVNEKVERGNYSVNFNASGLAGGVYFYKLYVNNGTNNFSETRKMLLIK